MIFHLFPNPTVIIRYFISRGFAAAFIGLFATPAFLFAQSNPDIVTISENEIVRRQARAMDADSLLRKSRQAVEDGNLRLAYVLSLEAVERIPSGVASDSPRRSTIKEFSETAVSYANWLIDHGQFEEAALVAKSILAPTINPNYKPAARILANLEQPDYYNKTIDPAFAAQRDDVERLLNQAEGYSATGRYDLATKRYEQVLGLDPYNIAARKGLESVNKGRTDYYQEAYNETRSRMLWMVEESWERPVPKRSGTTRSTISSLATASASKADITNKLNKIVIDEINFREITVREFVDFLKLKSRQLDPEREGINIVLKLSQDTPTSENGDDQDFGSITTPSTKISISPAISNIPLIEAIRYLTELSNLKSKINPYAVEILSPTDSTDDLVTKEYRVSPSFIPVTPSSDTPSYGAGTGGESTRLQDRRDAKKFLEEQGVPFTSSESFARYIPSGSRLVVRNTQSAIDTIDTIIEGEMGVPPNQVEIESKFVEISQNNLNELGFDWMLGPLSIGGGMYGNGGTVGLNQETSGDYYSNFPFNQIGGNPVTAGTRSGIGTSVNSAVTANSIDALIAQVPQGANVASPGIFGIAGVFTNPQFQMVIRALSQQKGVDLMSAPKVTTKSGNKATVKIVRDFPYPESFEPPEVPESSGGSGNNNTAGGGGGREGIVVTSSIITPSNPTDFTTRELGVTLEVEPVVGADNYTIDLYLSPRVVNFDGFVNYGSPVVGPRYNPAAILVGNPSGIETYTITPNTMNQPIFSVRAVDTNVTVWDGQTVALGGLIREDVQKVQDKVPLLGDIPLAGRLFRSNVDQTIKKNLIIFVTARLINAQGQPLIQQDVEEEFVELLGLPGDLPEPTFQSRKIGK